MRKYTTTTMCELNDNERRSKKARTLVSEVGESVDEHLQPSFDPRPFPIYAKLVPHRVTAFNEKGVAAFLCRNWQEAFNMFSEALLLVERGETFCLHDAMEDAPMKHNRHQTTTTRDVSDSGNKAIDEIKNEISVIIPEEEYDEGMDCFELPESWGATEMLTSDEMWSSIHFNIGLVRLQEGDFGAALLSFRNAQSKAVASGGVSRAFFQFRLLHKIGYTYFRSNNRTDALLQYHCALTLAMKASLDASVVAATLNCIAVIHFHQHSDGTERTMQLLQQSLTIYRECFGAKDTKEIATVLNNMGRVFYLQSEFFQALKVYKDAMSMRQKVLGPDSIDVAATVYNTAQTYHQIGKVDKALSMYHQFLSLTKARAGQDSRDIATVCRCIADIHQERGELKQAMSFLEEALQSAKTTFGTFHAETASILNKLGNICYETKDFQSALAHYRDGLKVENAILPPNHPHVIVTLTNIAHILKQRRDYSGSAMVYRKVLRKQRKAFGVSSKETAATLSSLGLVQYHLGDYIEAFDSYQEALHIRREHFGSDDHLDIASTLNSIGLVLFKQRSFDWAKSCFSQSLLIRQKLLGKNHRDVAVLWYNLATVYFEMGEDETAIRLYIETLRVEQTALGKDHPDVVLTLQHLGHVHQHIGRLDASLKYFLEALDIEKTRGSDEVSVAKIQNLIGNIYLQQGKVDMMMNAFVEATRILEKRNEGNEALVIAGYNYYGLRKLHPPCAPVA